jgi:osmoprotectant transport system ATP-binding protein
MAPEIEFRNLSFKTTQGRLLLDDVSLPLEEGTVTAILGRSGSGKTTLLRTVNRMIEPTSGEVRVRGASVQRADLIALRRGIGYVIQETGLFPHFTVERNVGVVLAIEGRPREERMRRSATCWPLWDRPIRICAPVSSSAFRRQRQRVGWHAWPAIRRSRALRRSIPLPGPKCRHARASRGAEEGRAGHPRSRRSLYPATGSFC